MDIEQMRIRMGEMAAEIERLHEQLVQTSADRNLLQGALDDLDIAQQSPAVADTYQRVVQLWNSKADEYNQWESLGEGEKIEFSVRCGISPRITEQDAGEILLSYGVEYIGILQWLKDNGRSTLAKLNEVSHETN
jgi:hypothetical protein